jgi:hypothetical protein
VTRIHLLSRGGVVAALLLAGCSASNEGTTLRSGDDGTSSSDKPLAGDDRAMCEFKGKKDVEVSETAGPGAVIPNVRRVYKVLGTGTDRRKVIACREVDTNIDGVKDTVRFYNDEGQSKEERADTNFDGRIDTWNLYANGRLAEERLDKNYDTKPDEWKIYNEGKLSRIKRDTNFDGKADVWEMYRRGRLERMGVDTNGDERVDRWDHDTEWRKALERAEEKKQEEEEKKKKEEQERRLREAQGPEEEG